MVMVNFENFFDSMQNMESLAKKWLKEDISAEGGGIRGGGESYLQVIIQSKLFLLKIKI